MKVSAPIYVITIPFIMMNYVPLEPRQLLCLILMFLTLTSFKSLNGFLKMLLVRI